ncbi:MAG: hypothetical protein SPI65_06700 [Peptoniphilus sp.]|nr:hypothetical protein [Peptoniphilus sp.]MDY6045244.1 hypothetical protein [Peptoniphilus sp.]
MIKENPYHELLDKIEEVKNYQYEMTEFEDQLVQYPWTFAFEKMGTTQDGNEIVHLKPYFGEVLNQGKNLSQKNLGNLDVGIKMLYIWRDWVNQQILSLSLKGDATDGSILNGFLAVPFYKSIKDIYDDGKLTVVSGYYDKQRGELRG